MLKMLNSCSATEVSRHPKPYPWLWNGIDRDSMLDSPEDSGMRRLRTVKDSSVVYSAAVGNLDTGGIARCSQEEGSQLEEEPKVTVLCPPGVFFCQSKQRKAVGQKCLRCHQLTTIKGETILLCAKWGSDESTYPVNW